MDGSIVISTRVRDLIASFWDEMVSFMMVSGSVWMAYRGGETRSVRTGRYVVYSIRYRCYDYRQGRQIRGKIESFAQDRERTLDRRDAVNYNGDREYKGAEWRDRNVFATLPSNSYQSERV